jgi:hypothetical protein
MTTPHDRWTDDMAIWDAELDRVLGGAMPSANAPAWCTDVAVLVRTAQAPAQPDEMRREDDIIARMTGLRLAVLAGDEPEGDVAGFPVVDVRDRPAVVLAPVQTADTADAVVRPPAEVDLRTPPAVIDELAARRAEEEAYTAKHSEERGYTAKHTASRLEASRHPAARTLGRVLAIKAVAITTAAAVGVAAAAATTGIVATVVVPAINDSTRRPITPAPATTTDHGDDDDEGSGGSRISRGAGAAAEDCEVTVTCSPDTTAFTLPPASTPTTAPAGAGTTVPGRPATPPESTTTSTTDPPTATTVDPPPDTTTTTSTTVTTTVGATSSSDP